jgi:hypothetical protein
LIGSNGRKLRVATSPVSSGTTPTTNSGISTASPTTVCTRAARRMPWCCSAKTSSSSAAAIRNWALNRSASPSFSAPRSTSCTDQVLIAASAGNSAVSRYPAPSPDPMASTGDQASQLHHTDTGATNLEYGAQAIAPYTEAPPDLFGNIPAISA